MGAIHGGTKHNIIPEEVDMKLTLRFFSDEVYKQIINSLTRICNGQAAAAGVPADRMPVITLGREFTPPVINDPGLVTMATASMGSILGAESVARVDPATVAEDFGKYGRTEENVKIALFWLGGVNQVKYDESISAGTMIPALHSSNFLPDFTPTYTTGVAAMARVMIDLFNGK